MKKYRIGLDSFAKTLSDEENMVNALFVFAMLDHGSLTSYGGIQIYKVFFDYLIHLYERGIYTYGCLHFLRD
jgi:hypothetical protein